MARKKKPKRVAEVLLTDSILVAFKAAWGMWTEKWSSPHGPAVVVAVEFAGKGHWSIEYRPIKVWGKEAWAS